MRLMGSSLAGMMAGVLGMVSDTPLSTPKGKATRTRRDVLHYEPRFARKTRKYGSGYRPGKLFKGHRI